MKNERGITLIALVVTIVVLLILAGVTMTYALGENGIFTSAQKAELATVKASLVDAVGTTQTECLIKEYDASQTVPSAASDLAALVANYLPSSWTVSSTDLAWSSKKLDGKITVKKDTKTYEATVENGAVTTVTEK